MCTELYPSKDRILRSLALVNLSLLFLRRNCDWLTDFPFFLKPEGSKTNNSVEAQSGGSVQHLYYCVFMSICHKKKRLTGNEKGAAMEDVPRGARWGRLLLLRRIYEWRARLLVLVFQLSSRVGRFCTLQRQCLHPRPPLKETDLTFTGTSGQSFLPRPHVKLRSVSSHITTFGSTDF